MPLLDWTLDPDIRPPVIEPKRLTFQDCAAADITQTFFNATEHANYHFVDEKKVLVILEEDKLNEHSSHWEGGTKQNFDTGLYDVHTILYLRVEDYGPKPKVGKPLVLDRKRTYTILSCEEESGVYRMTLKRVRQA